MQARFVARIGIAMAMASGLIGAPAALGASSIGFVETPVAVAVDSSDRVVAVAQQVDYLQTPPRISVTRINANGSLDTGFGDDGFAVIGIDPDFLHPEDVAIQPDGKIVVVGQRVVFASESSFEFDLVAYRLEADGDLDPSFGGDGQVAFDLFNQDQGKAVEVQSDGKIVIAGFSTDPPGAGHQFVLRLNTNGALDTTSDGITPGDHFGTDGKVVSDQAPLNVGEWIGAFPFQSLALQPDGKILLNGLGGFGTTTFGRLADDGAPDPTFGTGGDGAVSHSIPAFSDFISANGLQVHGPGPEAGKIVVAGPSISSSEADLVVGRLDSSGALDGGFDADGSRVVELGTTQEMDANPFDTGVALDDATGSVTAGATGPGPNFGVARLDASGALDAGFGVGGTQTIDFGAVEHFVGLAFDSNGNTVAAGMTQRLPIYELGAYLHGDFAVARLDTSGTLDSTFNGDGKVIVGQVGVYDVVEGTTGNDQIEGTSGNDVIHAGGGNDTIDGGGGNDVILGEGGKDVINGEGGNDTINGGAGNDTLNGDSEGSVGAASLRSAATTAATAGKDTLIGGAGNDKLNGQGGNDKLNGQGGNDKLRGQGGKDKLKGGPGKDLLIGGPGLDVMIGGPGRDRQRQ